MARTTRLRDSSRRQVRIQDLARELGISSRVIIDFLRSGGEYVKSPMSNVEPPVARRVRDSFPPYEVRNTTGEDAPVTVPPDLPLDGLSPPSARPKRENNPYVTLADRERENVPYRRDWFDDHHRRAADDGYTVRSEDPTVGFAAATGQMPSPSFEFQEWQIRGISETERDVWISHGLKPHHARIAADCLAAGIGPTDLSTSMNGWTILDRVTRGEGAVSLARKLRRGTA